MYSRVYSHCCTFLFQPPVVLAVWLPRRQRGQEGFVPASYMQEIEPTKVKKLVKKKELVNVPVKVTKKKMEKRWGIGGRGKGWDMNHNY